MSQQIDRLPGVYFEEGMTYELTGEGSKIPVFIGVSNNSDNTSATYTEDGVTYTYTVDGTTFKKIKTSKWNDIKDKTIADGGILATVSNETKNNSKLYHTLSEFFEESKLVNSGDIGVPYVYIIDVGTGKNINSWINAYKTAKKLLDVQIEVYDGAVVKTTTEGNTTTYDFLINDPTTGSGIELKSFFNTVMKSDQDYSIYASAKNLDLRCAFFTIYDNNATYNIASDTQLLAYSESLSATERDSRLGFVETHKFGKHIARICCTPYNTEPGYFKYRSINPGEFKERSKQEMLNLQNAGIIFGRDEFINGNEYPKINLCVSTAFSTNPTPADSLFHARFNADSLLNEVFEACYKQVKANESATNIAYLQTRINKIVNDRVSAEEMIKWNEKTERGTKLTVSESDDNPFILNVTGFLQPVKCAIAIRVYATIQI